MIRCHLRRKPDIQTNPLAEGRITPRWLQRAAEPGTEFRLQRFRSLHGGSSPMKRFMHVAVMAVLVSAPVLAAETGKVEEALMQTEQMLTDSLLKHDSAPFKKTLDDSFVFVAPDGSLQERAAFIADLDNGNLKITSTTNEDMAVRVYGDTAVVSYRSTDKGMYKDTDISGQYRWTDVFVKQKGEWRIVATQGTPIAPMAPAAPTP
jgi:ketosteroid isomerase-like protein